MTKLKRLVRKIMFAPIFWVVVAVLTLTAASNQPISPGISPAAAMADERPSLKAMNEEKTLLREGTLLTDSKGRFKFNEDRIAFTDESLGKTMICLENIVLQRIHVFSKDDGNSRQRWNVSGKITEFNGENFLWLDRATRAQ
jgi:hypothetical protein